LKLTRILGILRADILVTRVKHVFVHQRGAGRDLSEEGNLDGFANLHTLTLLHKDLASVLASVFAIQAGHTILLRMMSFLERLQCCHEVVATGDTGSDDTLGDTSGDGTLDNGGDGVHGSDDLVLKLWGHVELDLLEKVLGSSETADNEHVLLEGSQQLSNFTRQRSARKRAHYKTHL
jgi:hypothetical protein